MSIINCGEGKLIFCFFSTFKSYCHTLKLRVVSMSMTVVTRLSWQHVINGLINHFTRTGHSGIPLSATKSRAHLDKRTRIDSETMRTRKKKAASEASGHGKTLFRQLWQCCLSLTFYFRRPGSPVAFNWVYVFPDLAHHFQLELSNFPTRSTVEVNRHIRF